MHAGLDRRLALGPEEMARFRQALRARLARPSYPVFVAKEDDNGRLVGCIMGTVVDNRPLAVLESGYINCLLVEESSRRKQVGGALLRRTRRWMQAEGLSTAQVDVSHRNHTERRFWEREGFTDFLDHLCRDTEPAARGLVEAGVKVRQAEAGDLDAVLSLWEEMMEHHAPLDPRLRVIPGWRRYMGRATGGWLSDEACCLLVAEAGDEVIGFALGRPVGARLSLKPAPHGHVAHLCVTASWRRRGIGRALFAALREWFSSQRLSSIHVHVSHFSSVSQRFWRTLGFSDYMERLWCDLS